jgi:hypothetical protein
MQDENASDRIYYDAEMQEDKDGRIYYDVMSSKSRRSGYRWKPRKVKILRVNPEIFGMLCLQSASYKVTSGLPADARCIHIRVDLSVDLSDDIHMLIESEEYEPVEQGELIQYLDANILVIERLDT